jgi:hypothetical protein
MAISSLLAWSGSERYSNAVALDVMVDPLAYRMLEMARIFACFMIHLIDGDLLQWKNG